MSIWSSTSPESVTSAAASWDSSLHHPVVGDLSLTYEALDLAADAGLRISAYTAEPGSASEDALNLLASWAATLDRPRPARRPAKPDLRCR